MQQEKAFLLLRLARFLVVFVAILVVVISTSDGQALHKQLRREREACRAMPVEWW